MVAFASYKGIVKGNVVILQEETPWPDDTPVVVISAETFEQEPDWEADPFLRVDVWGINTGIADLAERHDYYASGVDTP